MALVRGEGKGEAVGGLLPQGYGAWLSALKQEILQARQRAAFSVNAELIGLYHRIGREILQRQSAEGWGAKVLQRLSQDLGEAFPDARGFSKRNLHYMALFAQACPDGRFVQQPAAQWPWFHVVTLLTKLDSPEDRAWYAEDCVAGAWSRSSLEANIKSRLRLRQGAAVTKWMKSRSLDIPWSNWACYRLRLAIDEGERFVDKGCAPNFVGASL